MWTSDEVALLAALGDTRGFCPDCRGEWAFERPPAHDATDACFEVICSGCGAAFLDAEVPISSARTVAGDYSPTRSA